MKAKPATVQAQLILFHLDMRDPDHVKRWEGLQEMAAHQGTRWVRFNGPTPSEYDYLRDLGNSLENVVKLTEYTRQGTVTVDTSDVFGDQWNTQGKDGHNGFRVHNAVTYSVPNRDIKTGMLLILNDELRHVMAHTFKCGYCGKTEWRKHAKGFCTKCRGSVYLKECDLRLLRLLPVTARGHESRAPLTDAERAVLLPSFQKAQLKGNTRAERKAIAKRKAAARKHYTRVIRTERIKRDVSLWVLDNLGAAMDENSIYYDHTNTVSFGWRATLDQFQRDAITEALTRWPFAGVKTSIEERRTI